MFLLACWAALLSGCQTQAFLAVRATCSEAGYRAYPPELQQRVVDAYRYDQVPTGGHTCVTTEEGNTRTETCTPDTRSVRVDYTEVITVDLVEDERLQYAHACTHSRCMQEFGNGQCRDNTARGAP